MNTQTISPKIGKDVIETLTLGMYEDARFIFREYIQNAADQIDEAVSTGLFATRESGQVDIMLDSKSKRIVIEDNATGIPAGKVVEVLGNIAVSQKDRTKQRGFRGIGRLGGLGYCTTLVFECSYAGEAIKSRLTWDAKELKAIINDRSYSIDATELIRKITLLEREPEEAGMHYFRVCLEGVSNEDLLDEISVRGYLNMVAPVPFAPGFLYRKKIHTEFDASGVSIDEFNVFVNTNPLVKAYSTNLYAKSGHGKKIDDRIYDIEFRRIEEEGQLLGLMWFGISKFEKRLPESLNPACGIRLRKGNIQIGNQRTLIKYFKETRGNFYYVGEIHAIHPDLIPNARRDFFVENWASEALNKGLREICSGELNKLYHDASTIRNAQKRVEKVIEVKEKYDSLLKNGFTSLEEREGIEQEFEKVKVEAGKAQKKIENLVKKKKGLPTSVQKVMDRTITPIKETNIGNIALDNSSAKKTPFRTQKLTKQSKQNQKLIGKIFTIIDQNMPPEKAEFLKQKIEEAFK